MYLRVVLFLFLYQISLVFTQNETNCFAPKVQGVECSDNSTHQYRWYFNKEKFICLQFRYKGCNGSENNFHSLSDCLRCYRKIEDAFQCWGNGKGGNGKGEKPRQTCKTFNCTAPYTCVNAPFFPRCCDYSDSLCPDGTPVYKHDNGDYFGDNCDDLNCPESHRCSKGKYFARCCRKTKN